MIAPGLALMLALQAPSAEAFRAQVIVEEAGESATYDVHFGEGTIRIDPPEAELYLLVDVATRGITLVYPNPGCYYRMEPPEHRSLIEAGILKLSWFPWVAPVSLDLIDGVSLESRGRTSLPDGRAGVRYEGTSPAYDRVVAAYTVDPNVSADLFFQWRDVYFELWGEGLPEVDDPQRKRIDLYSELPGLPIVSEERFLYLSRPRTTRLEGREQIQDDVFTIPDEYEEGDPRELYWKSVGERLLRQFGMKEGESALCSSPRH